MDIIATQYQRTTRHAADLFAAHPELVTKGYQPILTIPAHDDPKARRQLAAINLLIMQAVPTVDRATQARYGLLASAARDMQTAVDQRAAGRTAHAESAAQTVTATLDTYEATR